MTEKDFSLLATALSLISVSIAALSLGVVVATRREAYRGARAAFAWSVRARQVFAAPHRPWTPNTLSVSAYDMREDLRRGLRDLATTDQPKGADILKSTMRFIDDIFEWRDVEDTPIQELEKANGIYLRWVGEMGSLLAHLDPVQPSQPAT